MPNEGVLRGLSLAMTIQNATGSGRSPSSDAVRDGLIIYYDGINNTGFGHKSNTPYWTDISGQANHGLMYSGVWGEDELVFNGSSTWVNCGRQDYGEITLEVVFSLSGLTGTSASLASNLEYGGYNAYISSDNSMRISTHRTHEHDLNYERTIGPIINVNEYHMLTGTASTSGQAIYVDGELIVQTTDNRTLDMTYDNTVMALGINPTGAEPYFDDGVFWGRMKSFRMYNRALTASEVAQNWRYDRARFGL